MKTIKLCLLFFLFLNANLIPIDDNLVNITPPQKKGFFRKGGDVLSAAWSRFKKLSTATKIKGASILGFSSLLFLRHRFQNYCSKLTPCKLYLSKTGPTKGRLAMDICRELVKKDKNNNWTITEKKLKRLKGNDELYLTYHFHFCVFKILPNNPITENGISFLELSLMLENNFGKRFWLCLNNREVYKKENGEYKLAIFKEDIDFKGKIKNAFYNSDTLNYDDFKKYYFDQSPIYPHRSKMDPDSKPGHPDWLTHGFALFTFT